MSRRDAETIDHRVGEGGTVVLRSVSGSVRVRGVDGDEARVRAHLDLHRDEDASDVLDIVRGEGELRVEVRGRRLRGLAGLLRSGGAGHLDVEMPRGATLRLSGVSADLEVAGLEGDQEYRTVSGDLAVSDGGGTIAITSVSGDVRVGSGTVRLQANTTSGDLAVDAQRLQAVQVKSLSGDVHLAGLLEDGVHHRVESVSGDLQVMPVGGLRLEVSGFSSDVDSELPYREESGAGRRVLVVGDGAAHVTFRTMSGDASVLAGRFEGDPGAGTMSSHPVWPPRAPTPPRPPRAPSPPPLPPRPSMPSTPGTVAPQMDRLEILRAVESGRLDIDEAARLLEEAGDE